MGLKTVQRRLAFAVIALGGFSSCANFGYHYYGLDAKSYEGSLLGPSPQDDIPLEKCKPDDQEKGKCIVMLRDEAYRLKEELLNLRQALKDCQHGQ